MILGWRGSRGSRALLDQPLRQRRVDARVDTLDVLTDSRPRRDVAQLPGRVMGPGQTGLLMAAAYADALDHVVDAGESLAMLITAADEVHVGPDRVLMEGGEKVRGWAVVICQLPPEYRLLHIRETLAHVLHLLART